MASTRNKNTPGNYCLDQKQNVGIETWQLYKNGANGRPNKSILDFGFV